MENHKYSFRGILKDGFFGKERVYLILGSPYYTKDGKWCMDVYIESLTRQVIFVTVANSKSPKIIIYPINWYINYQIKKGLIDDYEINLDKESKISFRIDLGENLSFEDSLNFNLTSRLHDDILKEDYFKSISFKIPSEKSENLSNIFRVHERQTACV